MLSKEINNNKEYDEIVGMKDLFIKLTSLFLEITGSLYAYEDKSSYLYKEVYKIYESIHTCIKSFTMLCNSKGTIISWKKNVCHALQYENLFEENKLYLLNPIRMKYVVGKALVEEYENACYTANDSNAKNIASVLITTIELIMNDIDIDEITQQLMLSKN